MVVYLLTTGYVFEAFVGYIKRDIIFARIKSNADYSLVCEEPLNQQDQQAGVTASQQIAMRGGKAFSTTLSDHTLRLVTVWDEKKPNGSPNPEQQPHLAIS